MPQIIRIKYPTQADQRHQILQVCGHRTNILCIMPIREHHNLWNSILSGDVCKLSSGRLIMD